MSMPAIPSSGGTPWATWGTAVHDAATEVVDGRLNATNLAETIRDTIASALVAGSGATITVDDAANTITITATATGTTDPEVVRDTIGTALVGTAPVTKTVNDAGDTITIAVSAASDTAQGVVELATSAETTTGTDTTRATHPAGVKAVADTKLGIVSGSGLADIHKVTQAAYDALGAGRPAGRIYVIVG
jgi:hypothetical protein